MSQQNKQKQLDLQGIRGLAIIAVLGFHFYPNCFPNGYLGVDQFFVLSGFLMCMLLTRSENLPVLTIMSTFYSRRFKRILPLYLLFIAATLVSLFAVFPDVAKRKNLEAVPRALLFASNQPKTDEDDYFEMLEVAIDVFTHTWSLSVEIQFYLVIPILFIIGDFVLPNYQVFYYGFIALISYGFNFLLEKNVAFNSMFARIWQFMTGMIVYSFANSNIDSAILPRTEDETEKIPLVNPPDEKSDAVEFNVKKSLFSKIRENVSISTILLLACCSITLSPYELHTDISRPLATILTGLLMYFAKENKYLSNRYLTYIGDISYSLYLIHWPCYAYWKLAVAPNQYALFDYLQISIVLAAIVYEYFEKWYLTLSNLNITFLIVFLLLINSILLWKENKSVGTHGIFTRDNYDAHIVQEAIKNMNFSEINEINLQWNADDMKNLKYRECDVPDYKLFGTCDTTNEIVPVAARGSTISAAPNSENFKNLKTSKAHRNRIFVFGNSWASNNYRLIHDECSKNSNAIRMTSESGCEPFGIDKSFPQCWMIKNKDKFFNALKEFQPDYAFYFARTMSFGSPLADNVTSLDNDKHYKLAEAELLRMLPFIKKKLYILDAFPSMNAKGLQELGTMLQNQIAKEKIDNLLLSPSQETYKMAKKRYAKLFEVCGSKCGRMDYTKEFWNSETGTYRFYDNYGLEYMTNGLHLTPHGLQKVRHIFTEICRKME